MIRLTILSGREQAKEILLNRKMSEKDYFADVKVAEIQKDTILLFELFIRLEKLPYSMAYCYRLINNEKKIKLNVCVNKNFDETYDAALNELMKIYESLTIRENENANISRF